MEHLIEPAWVKADKLFTLIPLALAWAMLWLAGRPDRKR